MSGADTASSADQAGGRFGTQVETAVDAKTVKKLAKAEVKRAKKEAEKND